jgi:protein-S-isoprenylcysteine O-methyltransferase Ste14
MYYLLVRLFVDMDWGVIAPVVIFGLAGRWDLWNVWAYAGIAVVLFSFQALAVYRKYPDLLTERIKPPTRGRSPVPPIGGLVLAVLIYSIVGLDQRFHWSDVVPLTGIAVGLVIVAIGLGLFAWAMLVNPFFSFAVRTQADRGHQVISVGPYAIVRHPGYAGQVLFFVASGVALNSLLSIIPIVVLLPLFFRRTAIEDRMLHDELADYADYAAKVRYRLIPGLW